MRKLISVVLFCLSTLAYSQKLLDLHYISFLGKQKSFQFFNNSNFTYKLKGDVLYHTHKIVNMQDSILVFENDSIIYLNQIKDIRIDGVKLSPYFFGAGLLFLLLDTGHNIAFGNPHIVSQQAILVSSICIVGCVFVRYIQDKHVRIKKRDVMRIIDNDFRNLQSD